jgi:glycosyltransferase involved in cell wall biosynthesis
LRCEDKPTLLLLTSSFPRGPGDETCGYIRDFARSLSREFDIEILAPRDSKPLAWTTNEFRLRRAWSLLPSSVDPFTSDADLNQLIDRGLCAKLGAAISLACFFMHAFVLALRCDVICSQWLVPCGLFGAMISRITGRPHIAVEHSGAIHVLRRMRGGRSIVRFIVANSFQVITVSADLKRKLIALCAEAATKTRVVSMGVNVTDETFANDSSLNHPRSILFIGRLTEIKGLDVLLKALEGIDNVVLTIAGDGPLRRDLERRSRELSVRASFAGRVTAAERQALLQKCDAVVVPSRELADGRCEGTPVVCLEAMAASRLVIASRVGGLAEVITDGHDGMLFDAEDHRMLREKLMMALSNDRLRERIATNGRRAIESYNWTAIGAQFIRILNDSLDNSLDNGPITHRQRRRAPAD